MRDVRDWIWFGFAIGAVWAFQGLDGAALALGIAAVGMLIGLVVRAPGGLRALVDRNEDDSL